MTIYCNRHNGKETTIETKAQRWRAGYDIIVNGYYIMSVFKF